MSLTYRTLLAETWRRTIGGQGPGSRRGRKSHGFSPELLEPRCLLSTVTEYPAVKVNGVASPREIVSAAGKLWYTDPTANAIGMIDPANPGNPQLITQGVPTSPTGSPTGLTVDPNGNLWFTLTRGIGKLNAANPAQPMTIYGDAYHGVGGLSAQAQITSIAAAPDGKVWFTDVTSYNNAPKGALGWVDPANPSTVHEVAIPSDKLGIASYDSRIIAGPSGSLWFTEATLSGGGVTSSAIAVYFPSFGADWRDPPVGRQPESPVAGGRARQQRLVHRVGGGPGAALPRRLSA